MSEKCHLLDLRAGFGAKIARATLGRLLFPAYRLGFKNRRASFLRRRSAVSGLPVVSVGNLALGGGGKTPLTLALCEALMRQGWRGGVVLKLGRPAESYFDELVLYLNALAMVGSDEPIRIERRRESILAHNESGFVFAHRNKLAALENIASSGRFQFALVDDGFQLYSLKPVLNVCVVRPTDWRERLFPLGELREETAALQRADIVLLRDAAATGTEAAVLPLPARGYLRLGVRPLGLLPARELARPWMREGEPEQPANAAEAALPSGTALAFSAIAHPEEFEQSVFALHADTSVCVRFPDHQQITTSHLRMLQQQGRSHGCRFYLTTEKDACRLLPHMLRALHARGHSLNWPEELLPQVRHFTPDLTVELEEMWQQLYFLKLATEVPEEVIQKVVKTVDAFLRQDK